MNFILSVMGSIGQFYEEKRYNLIYVLKKSLTAVEASGAAGDHLGSCWNDTMKYGGLAQGGNDGSSEKESDYWFI